jgi:uncharacterized protein (TIGR01319 family)
MAPTSVLDGDVTVGLRAAVESLERAVGERVSWGSMMATSSAAGGLRMTVHGAAYEMTVRAAREAALGAGAVVKMVTAGRIGGTEAREIARVRPSIVLLAGGVDYGDRETVEHNARVIASLGLEAPVVYAGNVAAREAVLEILGSEGVEVIAVGNVYPRIDELNVEPARRAVQRVFERHIVRAPGMEKIREVVDGEVIPTPGAVLKAAELLYRAIGDLMVVDVGGATTDVHSVTEGSEEIRRMLAAPEPLAKRTVEGDLGVFVNAANVAERVGWETLERELGLDARAVLERMVAARGAIPGTREEVVTVRRLARECAEVAVARHAGRVRRVYGYGGGADVAEGRDLTAVRWIIGTGGVFTRLPGGAAILEGVARGGAGQSPRGDALLPVSARTLVDHHYIMSSAGILGMSAPDDALELMRLSLARGDHPSATPDSSYHVT